MEGNFTSKLLTIFLDHITKIDTEHNSYTGNIFSIETTVYFTQRCWTKNEAKYDNRERNATKPYNELTTSMTVKPAAKITGPLISSQVPLVHSF